MHSPITGRAVALGATLALAGLSPPAASATVQIAASADPLAPAGRTPLVLFEASGLSKGARYRLMAGQRSGEEAWRDGPHGPEQVCDPALGSTTFRRANGKTLEWDPRPKSMLEQPALAETYYAFLEPCEGSYAGKLLRKRPGGARTVVRFRITVPGLKIKTTNVE